jgi:hypothetical protein
MFAALVAWRFVLGLLASRPDFDPA